MFFMPFCKRIFSHKSIKYYREIERDFIHLYEALLIFYAIISVILFRLLISLSQIFK